MHVHADILAVATHLSCLLRGNVIRANGYPFPKARVPFSRSTILETNVNHPEYRAQTAKSPPHNLPAVFPPGTPVTPKRRRGGAKPMQSVAKRRRRHTQPRSSEGGRSFIMN